jgi:D-glycero-beta-D-manno-heptose 1-phosphate adenylyltransferase
MDGPGSLDLEWFVRPAGRLSPVVCTGVFDILHVGHVRFLAGARAAGKALVVGVEDDRRVRARKGTGRPLVREIERAELVSALSAVDGVFIIRGPTGLWNAEAYAELLARMRPAALAVTAGDPAEPGKRAAAAMLAARLVLLPLVPRRSTSELVARAAVTPDVRPWEQQSRTPQAPRSPAPR